MRANNFFMVVLAAASLPLLAGCVEREVVYRDAPAPPAAQADVITPAPGPVDVWFWVPGCWEWRGNWVWIGGHWAARPHPGAVWVGPHWGWHRHHRVWIEGGWR